MHDVYIVNGIARVLILITKIVGSKFGLQSTCTSLSLFEFFPI